MTEKAQPLPPVVAKLAKAIVLRNIQPLRMRAEQVNLVPGDIITNLDLNLGGGGRKSDTPPQTMHCFFALSVTGQTAPPESRDVALVSVVIGLAYEVTDAALFASLTEEDLQSFSAINGIRQAWPYLREICQSLSLRLGVTPILLPLVSPAVAVGSLSQNPEWVEPPEPGSPLK